VLPQQRLPGHQKLLALLRELLALLTTPLAVCVQIVGGVERRRCWWVGWAYDAKSVLAGRGGFMIVAGITSLPQSLQLVLNVRVSKSLDGSTCQYVKVLDCLQATKNEDNHSRGNLVADGKDCIEHFGPHGGNQAADILPYKNCSIQQFSPKKLRNTSREQPQTNENL